VNSWLIPTCRASAARLSLNKGHPTMRRPQGAAAVWIHSLAVTMFTRTGHVRIATKGWGDIPLRPGFLFLERGTPPAFAGGTSSRPHDQAYSTAGAFLREGGVCWEGATFAGPLPEQQTTADYRGQQTRGVSPTTTTRRGLVLSAVYHVIRT
jgi:hypothetical protein